MARFSTREVILSRWFRVIRFLLQGEPQLRMKLKINLIARKSFWGWCCITDKPSGFYQDLILWSVWRMRLLSVGKGKIRNIGDLVRTYKETRQRQINDSETGEMLRSCVIYIAINIWSGIANIRNSRTNSTHASSTEMHRNCYNYVNSCLIFMLKGKQLPKSLTTQEKWRTR